MSRVAGRRKDLQARRWRRRQAQKALRERQKARGLVALASTLLPNRTCEYETVEEERTARQDAALQQIEVMRAHLPVLLEQLSVIPDIRDPKKIKHKLSVLLVYGILTFVYQMTSRREANRTMTRPAFLTNLKLVFPELESLPHHDTLNRVLSKIDVNKIEEAHVALVRRLIRNKKFARYLIANCYPIAVDGTQKPARYELLSEEWLQRRRNKGKKESETQYYVYVLEANLCFHNGLVIPLLSEFLSYTAGDTKADKQDCETRAFGRLAARLKKEFSHLPILLLLDGLYPNGPILEICRENHWQFMIVLQDKTLPSVWEEYVGLLKLLPHNHLERTWRNRTQSFSWVNDIEYWHGPNEKKSQVVHVVVCEETWEEIDRESEELVTRRSRHAWLSSEPLEAGNLHERCNLGARHRWGIETGILVEKRQGYCYEHDFSHNWDAMRGYHFLMRIGHALNVLVQHSRGAIDFVRKLGVRGFLQFLRETMTGLWIDFAQARIRLEKPFQLRLE